MRIAGLLLGVAAGIATLVLLLREEGEPLTEAALAAAWTRWQGRHLRNYDLEVETRGARASRHAVKVRDGEVVAQTTDGVEAPRRVWGVWSVDGMFGTLRTELANAARPRVPYGVDDPADVTLRVDFDADYGHPAHFLRHVLGRTASVEWRVVAFRPNP